MARMRIRGGQRLSGDLRVQGAKNAALPILAAALLNEGTVCLHACPDIKDVRLMLDILRKLGAEVSMTEKSVSICMKTCTSCHIPSEAASAMRSSVILMGAMLGRFREVTMPYPGGCTIGARPINWHIDALQQMNAEIVYGKEGVYCKTDGIKGERIQLPFPSVGVTENTILAAVLAEGETEIRGAALEPEIGDLCRFLNSCGAKIRGIGTGTLFISGVKKLHDTEYTIMADRIVAGTYMTAVAAVGGEVLLHGLKITDVQSTADVLVESGCGLIICQESIKIISPPLLLAVPKIETMPYPGFPTDMQSMLMVCMCCAYGESHIVEHIFENRFKIVPELQRMGADITVSDREAVIHGVRQLQGCRVTAYDLRGGAALCLAGLAAGGETILEGAAHIDRGYVDLCGDLQQLGADITMI